MTTTDAPRLRPRAQKVFDRLAADKRLFKRVQLSAIGRFMREDKAEYGCRLSDISLGGCAIESQQAVTAGERIIAYFDEVGRLEGTVIRTFSGGFAIETRMTAHKRNKLLGQITWLVNRRALGIPDSRKHDRSAPQIKDTTVRLPTGLNLDCEIIDVSISGASIKSQARPELGSPIQVGNLRASVVRHHGEGFAVRFEDIQNPVVLRRHFG